MKPLYFYTAIVFIIVILFVFIPLTVYSLRALMSIKNNIVFKKRHAEISQMFVIVSIVNFILMSHNMMARDMSVGGCDYVLNVALHLCILNLGVGGTLVWLFLLKIWMNYYDINYSQIIIDNEWKSLIDPNITNRDQHNWFIKHRATYGSVRYLTKYIILFCVTSLIAQYVLFIMNYSSIVPLCDIFSEADPTVERLRDFGRIAGIVYAPSRIYQLIAYPLIIIVRAKTAKFEDNFFIRQEINNMVVLALIFTVIEVLGSATQAMWPQDRSWVVFMRSFSNFQEFLVAIFLFSAVWIQTLWFIKKNQQWLIYFEKVGNTLKVASAREAVQLLPLSLFHRQSNKNNTALSTFNVTKIQDDKAPKETVTEYTAKLSEILNVEKGFSSFMYHLSYEFSVEILISLLEFYHYKKYIFEHPLFVLEERDAEEIKTETYFEIFSNEYVPRSQIVYGNKDNSFKEHQSIFTECIGKLQINENIKEKEKFKLLCECMISSHQLFIKYIQSGACAEINVSSTMRGILNDTFCSKKHNETHGYVSGIMTGFEFELCGNEYSETDSLEAFIYKRTDIASESGILSEINALYHVFDDCCEDMLKLTDYSFGRFRESTLYQKIQNDL
eukprot:7344_1